MKNVLVKSRKVYTKDIFCIVESNKNIYFFEIIIHNHRNKFLDLNKVFGLPIYYMF